MALENDLVAVLKPICARVYNGFTPTTTQRPYITFQQIGGKVIPTLAGAPATKENAEMQINVWANSGSEAKGLIKQIEDTLVAAAAFIARPLAASVSDFDADIPVYGSRQDFTIWADR